VPPSEAVHVKRVLETALLSSAEPLPIADLRKLFEEDIAAEVVRRVLENCAPIGPIKRGTGECRKRVAISGSPRLSEVSGRLNPQRPPNIPEPCWKLLPSLLIVSP
jgi:segregation and condensation protein B